MLGKLLFNSDTKVTSGRWSSLKLLSQSSPFRKAQNPSRRPATGHKKVTRRENQSEYSVYSQEKSSDHSSIVVGGLRPLFQTELSTQNYQQKSNQTD